ncbi:MAG: hypothetical protein AABY02_04790 [Nanoarchaeota archaeon]
MKKRVVVGVIVGVILIAAITGGVMWFGKDSVQTGTWTPITVTQDNVAVIMSQSSLVRDVPEDGVVAFYVGDRGYTITKEKMESGLPVNPDITITLPESYLATLGQYGWCAALQEARRNGNLGIELQGSKTSLVWKYRALEKYRLCLG